MNWLEPLLNGVIALVIQIFLVWAAVTGSPRLDPTGDRLLFRHSPVFRKMAILFAILIPFIFALCFVTRPPQTPKELAAAIGVSAFVWLLGIVLLWEAFRFGIAASADGLDCNSPWRKDRFFKWSDIQEVSYSTFNRWFVIRGKDGSTFHVPWFIAGIHRFLEMCELFLPSELLVKAKKGYDDVGRQHPGEA